MGGAEMALTTRLPDQAPLASLAAQQVLTDTLAVIVHPDNPRRELSMALLHDLFSGDLREWPGAEGEPVELAVREPGSGSRAAFDAAVLGEEALTATALILPGSEAMVAYVAGHPQSIGYVASGWLTDTVRAVTVDGLAPGDEAGYPLPLPVFVVTPQAATPASADFLAWLFGPGSPLRAVRR
jgi:phosphate transport system substrate-binding protein